MREPVRSSSSDPDPITALLQRFPVQSPPPSVAGAAVTIVLKDGPGGVETLLIERAINDRDPASGDVALPGGHVDPGDTTLVETAVRELEEEVGLRAADLDAPLHFFGPVTASRFGLEVGVFASRLARHSPGPTVGRADEVADIFWLPQTALARSELVRRGAGAGEQRVRATVHEGHVLWGFTRRVLRQFFELPREDPPRAGPKDGRR
jgi:8-oxo-dGTP diphosphatase